jgi:hypothetical protein
MSEPTVYCNHRKDEPHNDRCTLKRAKRLLRDRFHPKRTPAGTKLQRLL